MGEKFSEIPRVKLRQMMKKVFFTIGVQPGPLGFVDFQKPTGQFVIFSGGGEKWIFQKIGYFDPFYDQKITVTRVFMEHAGKNLYFRDVHIFVNRMKNMVIIKSENW